MSHHDRSTPVPARTSANLPILRWDPNNTFQTTDQALSHGILGSIGLEMGSDAIKANATDVFNTRHWLHNRVFVGLKVDYRIACNRKVMLGLVCNVDWNPDAIGLTELIPELKYITDPHVSLQLARHDWNSQTWRGFCTRRIGSEVRLTTIKLNFDKEATRDRRLNDDQPPFKFDGTKHEGFAKYVGDILDSILGDIFDMSQFEDIRERKLDDKAGAVATK